MSPIKFELESKFGSQYGEEEEHALLDVFRKNAPTSGDACVAFEQAFAAYCGVNHARAVSNGTAALFLALKALDIGPGDEVITTPLTWIATASAAATLGATVVFADIDPTTYNIDPDAVAEAITPRTKAILPVHLYGQCCDMDALLALSAKNSLAVVEDSAHAPGAEYQGRKAGSFGALGCFSFHEQKNMSTLGEGGMVVTNDPALFERVALYRSHCARVYGKSTKYCQLDEARFPMGKRFWFQDFDDAGYNFRMTDTQAAVGIEQLKKLDGLNARRIRIAKMLDEALADVQGLTLPHVAPTMKHVYHLYPVVIDISYGMNREDLIYRMFHERGVRLGTHYTPLHYSTAFQNRGYKRGQFPVAEATMDRLVTLPVHPRLTEEAVEYLVESFSVYARKG